MGKVSKKFPSRLVVAIGGNATHPENIRGTSEEQKDLAQATALSLLPLAQLDNELSAAYVAALARLGGTQRSELVSQQRAWLQRRDACAGNSQCLQSAYRSRMDELYLKR